MSTAAKSGESAPAKRGRLPLIIGVVVLFAAGGGGDWWWSQRAVVAAQGTGHGAAGDAHGERGAEPQNAATLVTAEGKDALTTSIGITAAQALHHEVVDVLLSDFVVQF